MLLPHTLVLEFRGSVVTELEGELGGGLDAAYGAVTDWLEEFHEDNRDKLTSLGRWFTVSCAALGAEVILWTLSITDTLLAVANATNPKPSPAPPPAPLAEDAAAWLRRAREARRRDLRQEVAEPRRVEA